MLNYKSRGNVRKWIEKLNLKRNEGKLLSKNEERKKLKQNVNNKFSERKKSVRGKLKKKKQSAIDR